MRVAVLTEAGQIAQVAQVAQVAQRWPGADVVPVHAPRLPGMRRALARLASLDVVVDLRGSNAPGPERRWRALSPYLRAGGQWLVPEAAAGTLAQRWGPADDVGWLSWHQERHHLLKVRDDAAAELVPLREPGVGVEVVAAREPGTMALPPVYHYGVLPQESSLELSSSSPRLECRSYRGPIRLTEGACAFTGSTLLPETFRWYASPHPANEKLKDVDAHFARLRPAQRAEPTLLEGSYFFLDYRSTGHFGHFMTEAMARLWAWPEAKARFGALKILLRVHPSGGRVERPAENAVLPALGVAAHDVAWMEGPTEVEHLVGATPAWHNADPFFVHPAIFDTWRAVRDDLAPAGSEAGVPERIFLTRPPRIRACRNAAAVEEWFVARGFTVVQPGELPVTEQARVFAGARVVAGFGGSAMFSLAYARRVEHVIVLNPNAYAARNELMFAAAQGATTHVFWSASDLAHPDGGFDYEAHQSDWDFDFAANGADLERVVAQVG